MATRLYFRNLANIASGTYPAGEQSLLAADYTAAAGATLKRLSRNVNLANGMTSHAGTSLASLLTQSGLYGMFVSNRFGENQDIANQVFTINIAMLESDANMNMGTGLTANVYIWRPSTGAIVGTVCPNVALTGLAEPTAGSVRVVQGTAATTTPVSALFADVLICEVWQSHTQGAATAFTGEFHFNGSVVTTVNDTLVTDHASFINFSFDNLQIEAGFADGTFDVTLGALTLTGAGAVTTPPPAPVVVVPSTGSGSGASRPRKKRKFVVPQDKEEDWSLDKVLGLEKPPAVPDVTARPKEAPKALMAPAMQAERVLQPPMPKPTQVVVAAEEYSDEDLIALLLLVL